MITTLRNRTAAPVTFRAAVIKGLKGTALAFLPFAALAIFTALQPMTLIFAPPESPTTAVAQATEKKVERLLQANDCDLPKDVIPGHSVVTVGGVTKVAHSDKGFAIWLGQDGEAGTGDEAPGTVHGFCR